MDFICIAFMIIAFATKIKGFWIASIALSGVFGLICFFMNGAEKEEKKAKWFLSLLIYLIILVISIINLVAI